MSKGVTDVKVASQGTLVLAGQCAPPRNVRAIDPRAWARPTRRDLDGSRSTVVGYCIGLPWVSPCPEHA